MLTYLSLLLGLGATATPADSPAVAGAVLDGAPVRLWMNNDRRYRPGDRVRLQVDADADGYLLVLHFDPEGRVRVLFPLDPRDDGTVRAGRRYEVRDASGDGAFRAYGDGTGLIYTAVSEDPWRFDQVTLADRWDYTRLEIDRASTNPEADLTNMLQGIAGARGFDYDVIGYRVYGESSYGYTNVAYPTARVFLYDSYSCNNWYWRSSGCRPWMWDGGLAFGYGYDPYYYRYGRYGYGRGYGYGYGYGNGYGYGSGYPYYPSRPVNGNTPVIVGRSRNYDVVPRSSLPGWNGGAGRPSRDFGGSGARAPSSGRGPDGGTSAAPPARRSRPEGVEYPIARESGSRGGNVSGGDPTPRSRSEPSRPRNDPPQARPASQGSGSSGGSSSGSSRGSAPAPASQPAPRARPRP